MNIYEQLIELNDEKNAMGVDTLSYVVLSCGR
jgi:hypothetical protein